MKSCKLDLLPISIAFFLAIKIYTNFQTEFPNFSSHMLRVKSFLRETTFCYVRQCYTSIILLHIVNL